MSRNFVSMETKKKDIVPGMQAEEVLYGYSGIVKKIFANFWSIPGEFIRDKQEWLKIQVVPIDTEERMERWIAIDCMDGTYEVAPESRVKVNSCKTFDVMGIFLQSRDIQVDSTCARIRPMQIYTISFIEEKQKWFVVPKIHLN